MFAQAAAEDLPSEFDGLVSGITINFPWGSLLRAALLPEPVFTQRLKDILRPGGSLSIVSGLDLSKDRTEMTRLGLAHLDQESLRTSVIPHYQGAGFLLERLGPVSDEELSGIGTAWSRKLRSSKSRDIFRIGMVRQ